MKGKNTLRLNADTVCDHPCAAARDFIDLAVQLLEGIKDGIEAQEALQEYFDKRTTAEGRFKVKSIAHRSENGMVSIYEVTTGEPQPGEDRGDAS
jgi:hypothetical protein